MTNSTNAVTKSSIIATTPLTMSSREIAQLTGKHHRHIRRDIRKMFEELRMSEQGYAQIWTDPQNGQEYEEYRLNKELTYTLIAGYSVRLRNTIVKRWMELEESPHTFRVPTNMAEALRLAADQYEELEDIRPKAIAFDELAGTQGVFTLRDSAKLCGWPEKIFISKLLMSPIKWLYVHSSSGRKLAYAGPIKSGYMDVKEVTVFHKTTGRESYGQPMITQKGLSKLAQMLGQFSPQQGDVA